MGRGRGRGRGGRDMSLISQTVRISQGPYKGNLLLKRVRKTSKPQNAFYTHSTDILLSSVEVAVKGMFLFKDFEWIEGEITDF